MPKTSLPLSLFLSNFILPFWNPLQHSPFHVFVSFSVFSHIIGLQGTTSTKYTKPYTKPRQSNLLSSYIQIRIPDWSSTLPIKIYYQAIYRLEYLIGQARYQSKGWIFRIRFSFKVIQHGQWQLCLQYNVSWILYKCSLIFITLLVHSTNATILTKKPFLYFSQFPPTYPTFTCSQNHPYNPQ